MQSAIVLEYMEIGAGFCAGAELRFEGTGIILTGQQETESILLISVDGEILQKEYAVPRSSDRQAVFSLHGLNNGIHTLKLTVLSGEFSIDSAQVILEK